MAHSLAHKAFLWTGTKPRPVILKRLLTTTEQQPKNSICPTCSTIQEDPATTLEEEVAMLEKVINILNKCPTKPAIPGEMVDRHFDAVYRCGSGRNSFTLKHKAMSEPMTTKIAEIAAKNAARQQLARGATGVGALAVTLGIGAVV